MFVAVLDTPLKSLLLTIWLIFLKQAFSWSKPDKNQVVRNNDLMWNIFWMLKPTLRKNWPNTEFYLVRIFPYLDWIRKNTDQKILRIWTFFAQFHLRFIYHQIKIVSKLIKYLLVILYQNEILSKYSWPPINRSAIERFSLQSTVLLGCDTMMKMFNYT